jgi:hypothetical protein
MEHLKIPTLFKPGTWQKIELLRQRLEADVELHIEGDELHQAEKRENKQAAMMAIATQKAERAERRKLNKKAKKV